MRVLSMPGAYRIGIAGLGTVGAGVLKLLQDNADLIAARARKPIKVVCVSSRNRKADRGVDVSDYEWISDAAALADRGDLDAVVELIGGADGVAKTLIEKTLENGRSVVTANKALLAHHGYDLALRAEKNNARLMYEASVAGCVPVIKALRESFASNTVSGIYGILNGTCNYILTQMRESGRGFEDVLREAQEKGYAEADPTFDVEGIDAGHKLCILTALAFGVRPDFNALQTAGISQLGAADINFAGELGYKIKLLGIAKLHNGMISQSVEPCLLPAQSSLGAIEDVYNAVFIEGDFFETPLMSGRGAGAGPTASAVVADLIDLARAGSHGGAVPTFGVPAAQLKPAKIMDRGETESRYYLRMSVLDKPGVIADVSAILRDLHISIESVIQHGRDPDQPVDVMITTHTAKQKHMSEACARIANLACSVSKPCLMRIESGL